MQKLVCLVFLFFSSTLFGQNAIVLLRSFTTDNSAMLYRTISTPRVLGALAADVGLSEEYSSFTINYNACQANLQIERVITENSIKSPLTVYGPYNYMRAFSSATRNEKLVNSQFLKEWKKINKTTGYNGVHHLVSRSTIKRIYDDLKKEGKIVSLKEMENNAPAIFHPMHGCKEYQSVFHNTDEQYNDYKRFGMHVTVIGILAKIDLVNLSLGLKPMPKWYLEGILKETELWCRYYGIIWEK